MTELEINRQIDAEFLEFNKATYEGDALPKDLMERYKKAIFKSAPSSHRLSSDVIRKQIDTKLKDLTNYEVGHILNTISNVPLCDLYSDLDEAIIKNKELELLKVSYNIMIKNINEQMDEKRKSLLSLVDNKPAMKIIATA